MNKKELIILIGFNLWLDDEKDLMKMSENSLIEFALDYVKENGNNEDVTIYANMFQYFEDMNNNEIDTDLTYWRPIIVDEKTLSRVYEVL